MAKARFAIDGDTYTMTPTVPIRETAALDVLRALQVILVGADATDAPNERIAATLKWLDRPYYSLRYVQKGLTHLERAGRIARRWIDEETAWGVKSVRQIVLTQTFFANADARRKAKKANDSGPKNFGPPRAPSGAVGVHQGADPSFEGEQEKATRAGAADAGGGAPSSSPAVGGPDAGGEEPKTAEELEALNAAARERLRKLMDAISAGPQTPKAVPPARVGEGWRPKPRWERLHALPEAEKERLAEADPIIRRELEQARAARRAAEAAEPAPAPPDPPSTSEATPRGRDSPEIVAPPPAKPRRGLFDRLLGRG